MLVIDTQVGMLDSEAPVEDVDGVVYRINQLTRASRSAGDRVIFIQHWGPNEDLFAPNSRGWEILPSLQRSESDLVVSKTACDAFCHTELQSALGQHDITELLIAGWATDFCVDTAVRAAASLNYSIRVVGDAHTCADRPHLSAAAIFQHHNLTWVDLIVCGAPVSVVKTGQMLQRLGVPQPAG